VVSLASLSVACGGATFTIAGDDGGGGGSSGGSGSSSSGGGSSSGSSSGTSSGGGSSSSSGAGSSSGGAGSSSSSGGCSGCDDGGPPSPCPFQLPLAGHACSPNGLACEYGNSPVQACDRVATCAQSLWQIQGLSTSANCGAGIGPMCPASFASVPQNTHCGNYGLVCDYPQGRCECAVTGGPVPVDASAAARWLCQDPTPASCPIPRAPLGSACTQAQQGLSCDYGACFILGGTAELCASGLWKQTFVPCPAFASGG
jgi:hypothetical protein